MPGSGLEGAQVRLQKGALSWIGVALALVLACAGAPSHPETPALRVGTTGDFPPYSRLTPDGYEGIDIALAQDLGRTLGRRVEFVETSWSSLLEDMVRDRFDLAMSGINVTVLRSRVANFSDPYSEDARVAVVRCGERDRFARLEDMDTPQVTVFVRYGSTSAGMALRRFARARVEQVPDWEAAFDRSERGRWRRDSRGNRLRRATATRALHRPWRRAVLGGADRHPAAQGLTAESSDRRMARPATR